MTEWHILTGQYPPQPGGVSDLNHLLACSLVQAGDTVRIWAPPSSGPDPLDAGIRVHRLPDHFGPRSLGVLGTALHRPNSARRLLIQYVPHGFGWKAMNLPLCLWLYGRRHRERIWVMFHEVAFPIQRGQPLRHNFLGCVHRLMAALVSRAAERCFVATLSWLPFFRRFSLRQRIEWLPVPSNIPTEVSPQTVESVRFRYGTGADRSIVGHFGTFGDLITPLVEKVVPKIVGADPRRIGLLIGFGSDRVLPLILQSRPDLMGRLFATGPLSRFDLAAHIAACDLLVQPYPDGVTTRRGSLMAALALGVPVVTTSGALTEPIWHKEKLVALAPVESPEKTVAQAERFLEDPTARRQLGREGQEGYRRLFALERFVQALQR